MPDPQRKPDPQLIRALQDKLENQDKRIVEIDDRVALIERLLFGNDGPPDDDGPNEPSPTNPNPGGMYKQQSEQDLINKQTAAKIAKLIEQVRELRHRSALAPPEQTTG